MDNPFPHGELTPKHMEEEGTHTLIGMLSDQVNYLKREMDKMKLKEALLNASKEIYENTKRGQPSFIKVMDTPQNRILLKNIGLKWEDGIEIDG